MQRYRTGNGDWERKQVEGKDMETKRPGESNPSTRLSCCAVICALRSGQDKHGDERVSMNDNSEVRRKDKQKGTGIGRGGKICLLLLLLSSKQPCCPRS